MPLWSWTKSEVGKKEMDRRNGCVPDVRQACGSIPKPLCAMPKKCAGFQGQQNELDDRSSQPGV